MNRDELLTLLTPDAMQLLADVGDLDDRADVVGIVSRMRGAGHDAATVATVLTQAKLRRRGAAKFGPFAARMLVTEDGLQQATRLSVAAHHAERFRAAGCERVADLGCGIGADAMAFASLGFDVTAIDANEVTAAIATHNLAMFDNAAVRHARAEEVDLGEFDGLWFDPARREGGDVGASGPSAARSPGGAPTRGSRRLADPADWSPGLDFVFGTAAVHPIGVKLGPAIDHDLLPDGAETQWVSVGGDLVEATVWAGGLQRDGVGRSALILGDRPAERAAPGPVDDEPVGDLGEYVFEPDPAIIRARLIGDVAREVNGRMLSADIAWITGDEAVDTPFATAFRVREVLPLQVAKLKRALRERGIGRLEIKKRGVDLDPATFRTQLALKGDESATLICTRVGESRRALLADRVV
ncbi:MAG: class I SAM-dependent methyltransferase [Pseudoclavibacter sp.]